MIVLSTGENEDGIDMTFTDSEVVRYCVDSLFTDSVASMLSLNEGVREVFSAISVDAKKKSLDEVINKEGVDSAGGTLEAVLKFCSAVDEGPNPVTN